MKNQTKNEKTTQSGRCCSNQKQNKGAQNRGGQQPESCR